MVFNLPIDFSSLKNDRLQLIPFEDNLDEWAEAYVQDANRNPHVYNWLTYGPFASGAEYVAWYNQNSRPNANEILLAIVLKAGSVSRTDAATGTCTTVDVPEGTFAGICGLVGQPDRATVDMGMLLLTGFHRTFVSTHANALLLHACLDSPSGPGRSPGSPLGLRRVQWQANADNVASVKAAERLGFQLEGIIRWQQVLPWGKTGYEGKGLPTCGWDGKKDWGPGRHTAMLSLCWDDWVNGRRDHVDALVARMNG